jgi:peroxiredoxin
VDQVPGSIELLAISIDPPEESAKTDALIEGKFRLLGDPDLKVIRAYQIEMPGGGMANMGYVLVDAQGKIRKRQIDPVFGFHFEQMIEALKPR